MSAWKPFGKFKVGIVELEWLGSSDITPSKVDPQQHLSGRLFYPADQGARHTLLSLRNGIPWLPEYNYARGLATFLFFRAKGLLYYALQLALQNFTYLVGSTQLMDLFPGAALAPDAGPHPVVVFSHGLGGYRAMYQIVCSELASQGYVVLAVEHADGSASACKLAGGKGWRLYGGLGGEEGQVEKTRHRVAEMTTAHKVLRAMNKGEALPGLKLSNGANPAKFLCGALDFRCVAAIGHSYGGATTASLVAAGPLFRCGICLDPWWYAMPPESAALEAWHTRAPLLVMGSHDWNVPNAWGHLPCGESRQSAILQASKARRDEGSVTGGGAILLVVSGTSHNTFADPLALFGQHLGWLLEKLGLASRLDAVLGMHLTTTATLAFLSRHLPLTAKQREMQSWEPSKGHSALDRIKERTAAGQAQSGLLAKVFPRGKGLLDSVSDFLLNHALKASVRRELPPPAAGKGVAKQAPAAPQPQGSESSTEANAPDDVVTASEALEAALPSAEPASGPHPHAPSQPTTQGEQQQQQQPEGVAAVREGAAEGARGAARERQAGLLAAIGVQYSDAVHQEEAEEFNALLGAEHIFKCQVFA